MKRDDILTYARWAGEVERYHTWPVHRRQSVGEHTWQIMRIYFQIWGPLPSHIPTFMIWHDAGELVTGDLPFPIKKRNVELGNVMSELEAKAVRAMVGASFEGIVTEYELDRIKVCDLIEMWEFGVVESSLGNQMAQPIIDDIKVALHQRAEKLPHEDYGLIFQYVNRVRARFPVCL